MAWNEPGNNGQDPWDRGSGGGSGNGSGPDFGEWMKQFKKRNGGGGSGGAPFGGGFNKSTMILVAVLLVGLWFFSGLYIVDEQERGVVLRFGEYHQTTNPGLNWRPVPVDTVELVNVTRINQIQDRAVMLTQDENIIDVELSVQYRISSAKQYLFSLRSPDATVKEATQSAVREVVGKRDMDTILTVGRDEVAARTEELLQEILQEEYEAGLLITEVNLQNAQPPQLVQGAFADAIKAREDEERLKNEAQAYARDILPKARGAAARQVAEAEAYKERVIKESEGEAARFESLLVEYKKAPEITRERLFLDSMTEVLGNTSKIMLDVDKGSPLLYLPLDQLMKQRTQAQANDASSGGAGATGPIQSPAAARGSSGASTRSNYRYRGNR